MADPYADSETTSEEILSTLAAARAADGPTNSTWSKRAVERSRNGCRVRDHPRPGERGTDKKDDIGNKIVVIKHRIGLSVPVSPTEREQRPLQAAQGECLRA